MRFRRAHSVLLLVLALVIVSALREVRTDSVPGEFLSVHRAGRLVATLNAEFLYDPTYLAGQHVYESARAAQPDVDLTEHEFEYLPATAVLMAPLGFLDPALAKALWAAWNALAVAVTFLAAWKLCGGQNSGQWMALPLLALLTAVGANIDLGLLNPTVIACVTVGIVWIQLGSGQGPGRRSAPPPPRWWLELSGGALLGLGAVVQFTPLILAPWLVFRRRWLALTGLLLALGGVGYGLPAAVLGEPLARDLHQQFWEVRSGSYTDAVATDLPGHSLKSFVYRSLGGVPALAHTGGESSAIQVGSERLGPRTLYWLVVFLDLMVLGLLFWRARPGGVAGSPERAMLLNGAAVGSLLLISPEALGPQFLALALPLTALTYALVRLRPRGARWWFAGLTLLLSGLLLQSGSTHLLGPEMASVMVAWCSFGGATLALCAGLFLLSKSPRVAGQAHVPLVAQAPIDPHSGDEAWGTYSGNVLSVLDSVLPGTDQENQSPKTSSKPSSSERPPGSSG
ncbi:MAG: glycosyltransferase 87 family protein [Planctomycetota bacterium]